jgi:hypothetical protein
MASTVTAATMTVTVSESITLNGKNQGSTNTLTLPGIVNISKRIVNVPNSEVEIIAIGADLAANTFGDLVNVTAYADTAACDIEVFVACD